MNPYTDSTDIQDQTAELLDRYVDRPEIAPAAADYPPEAFEPQYPAPDGIDTTDQEDE